ncbi:potassium transporter KefB [Pedobacter sp. SYP-B3415]|uniref:potassium transporter KefB n=1 Tax=Pedobacter sp. SYP-B3415 TaxID=2496641 RepID=UPI00101BBAF9|nr:potassium transporter KefB [Pedobacter sp. SYP-B3415]
MTHSNINSKPAAGITSLRTVLIGAGIAFLVISYFLIGAGPGNPAWPKYWQIKPLIMVPMAGAAGGAFYAFLRNIRVLGGWKTLAGVVIGIIGYLFILWIGIVLGLNGTMWD